MNDQAIIEHEQPAAVAVSNTADVVFSPALFEAVTSFSAVMAKGSVTIPQHLRGNQADCMAICLQAMQWKMNPYAVAQKTHLIHGTLGYEAQLVNAVITTMAPTKDRLHFEWFGPWENVLGKYETKTSQNGTYQVPGWSPDDEEGCGVTVWSTLKCEAEPRTLDLLLSQALVRNSTLWASDPKQQLAYLATKRWSRLYCPDVIMGVYTPDELESAPMERDITPEADAAAISEALKTANVPQEAKDQDDGAAYASDIAALKKRITMAADLEELSAIGSEIQQSPAPIHVATRAAYKARLRAIRAAKKASDAQQDSDQANTPTDDAA